MASSRVGARIRHLHLFLAPLQVLKNGQGEGGGLAGARLGLGDHILPGQQQRDDCALNCGRLGIAKLGHGLHQLRVQLQRSPFCCHG